MSEPEKKEARERAALPDKLPLPVAPIQQADIATTRWFVRVPPGVLVEHVLHPDFWVHQAQRLHNTPNKGVSDEIRIVAEDGSFDMDVTVLAVDPRGLWVQVRPTRVYEASRDHDALPVPPPADKEGYVVEFSGPHRWRILDRAHNVVAKDFADQAAAVEALNNIKAAKKRPA